MPLSTLRYSYRVVGVLETGRGVSFTYLTPTEADERVEELRRNPAIREIRRLTFETRTRLVAEDVFTQE
jgi:hypothetical protein